MKHEAAQTRLSEAYDLEIKKIREFLVAGLGKTLDEQTKTGNLDAALQIRDAKKFYETFDPRKPNHKDQIRAQSTELTSLRRRVKEL